MAYNRSNHCEKGTRTSTKYLSLQEEQRNCSRCRFLGLPTQLAESHLPRYEFIVSVDAIKSIFDDITDNVINEPRGHGSSCSALGKGDELSLIENNRARFEHDSPTEPIRLPDQHYAQCGVTCLSTKCILASEASLTPFGGRDTVDAESTDDFLFLLRDIGLLSLFEWPFDFLKMIINLPILQLRVCIF